MFYGGIDGGLVGRGIVVEDSIGDMTSSRRDDLQQMLGQRHQELATLVQTNVRGFREMDASDAPSQE